MNTLTPAQNRQPPSAGSSGLSRVSRDEEGKIAVTSGDAARPTLWPAACALVVTGSGWHFEYGRHAAHHAPREPLSSPPCGSAPVRKCTCGEEAGQDVQAEAVECLRPADRARQGASAATARRDPRSVWPATVLMKTVPPVEEKIETIVLLDTALVGIGQSPYVPTRGLASQTVPAETTQFHQTPFN